jgi:hypothetical protein
MGSARTSGVDLTVLVSQTSRVNLALAISCVLVFAALSRISGHITAGGGLGYDGRLYAYQMAHLFAEGGRNIYLRPFPLLLTRPLYMVTGNALLSFVLMNYVYVFGLALALSGLFDLYSTSRGMKAFFLLNIAICIATFKMFAYYPVLVDLGAIMLLTSTLYFIRTDRRLAAGVMSVCAALSREFGIVAVLFGVHRDLRRGVAVRRTIVTYAPAVAGYWLLRAWVFHVNRGNVHMLDVWGLLGNLKWWWDPVFAAFFCYFGVTIFGGMSMLLFARARECYRSLREEPEWATVLVSLIVAAALGWADIWRYLAYVLPVAAVLFARLADSMASRHQVWLLVLVTALTLVTQRPWQAMNEATYFRDWFPVYVHLDISPVKELSLWPTWAWRFLLAGGGMWLLLRLRAPLAAPVPATSRG